MWAVAGRLRGEEEDKTGPRVGQVSLEKAE